MLQLVNAGNQASGNLMALIQDNASSVATVLDIDMDGNGNSIAIVSDASSADAISLTVGTNDVGFFDFVATADADTTSAISTLNTSGATTDHIQISLNGTKAWVAVSTNNPS